MLSPALARVGEIARRHPLWADAAVLAVVTLICVPGMAVREPSGRDPGQTNFVGPIDWLVLAALLLPLLWRRRAPVLVFGWVLGVTSAAGLVDVDIPAQAIVPTVATYTLARHRRRRLLWPAVGALAFALTIAKLTGDLTWGSLVALGAVFAAAALLGVTVSTRNAYLAELEERARRLERERDQQAQIAAAGERARIAREMHDIVAHNLAVMIALADGARFAAGNAPDRAADAMRQVSDTGREALAEMRRLLGLLRDGESSAVTGDPATELSPQPGLDEIDRLVDQVRAGGVHVTVRRKGVPGRWGPGAGLAVYRIVQEALTNALKHAGAGACVDLHLRYTRQTAVIMVLDDGANRPASARPRVVGDGHGLTGMSERAAPYAGVVKAGPRRGTGWYVHARLRFDRAVVA